MLSHHNQMHHINSLEHLLASLNETQKKAVTEIQGPVMIIAGPGSGKTRVLTHKVAWLIANGIDPFRIMALTFTNKAADEMKERVMNLVGYEARNVWMGTFHSIFARILRLEAVLLGYQQNFTIYDTDDAKGLLKQILKENNLSDKTYSLNSVIHYISEAKMQLLTPDDYMNNAEIQERDKKMSRPHLGTIYKLYWDRCRRMNVMDFDDLLFNTVILFRDYPEVLKKYQNRFEYILVDEYQDTCYSQYLITKSLAQKYRNISVVGDDAQSIYAFRGARIENIHQFLKDFPDTKLIKLEQNYRSTQTIVQAANSLMEHNFYKIEKKLWSNNEKGEKIKVLQCIDEVHEAIQVAQHIFQTKMNVHCHNADFAVLYRTHSQSRTLEEAFIKMNIPYKVYGSLSFYKRKEIKDALAYFRLIVNPADEEAFLRVINVPARGIGATSIDRIMLFAHSQELSLWDAILQINKYYSQVGIPRHIAGHIDAFASMIQAIRLQLHQKNALEIATMILERSGYINMLKTSEDPEDQQRVENIEELINAISHFVENQKISAPDTIPTLEDYLSQVSLLTNLDEGVQSDDTVKLMTIHAAKGLEFPYVYIVGVEENLFPNIQTLESREELEEERRLFYVALTRAKKRVVITFANTRMRWGGIFYNEPGRFIFEIDPQLVDFHYPEKKYIQEHPSNFSSSDTETPHLNETDSRKNIASKQLKKLQDIEALPSFQMNMFDAIIPGAIVEHDKFGRGKVLHIDGTGDNKKAVVLFDSHGQKNLLLRFARLKVIS